MTTCMTGSLSATDRIINRLVVDTLASAKQILKYAMSGVSADGAQTCEEFNCCSACLIRDHHAARQ